jgi:hypothetical protein
MQLLLRRIGPRRQLAALIEALLSKTPTDHVVGEPATAVAAVIWWSSARRILRA